MSLENRRTSVFTFQSSVHSSHVLRCLDEQRQKDLLCDVTVVVENRSFRAHRSVLASCSDYFGARMSNYTAQGLVINLPDEVTAEGFEPLLQFAYTSKLLFSKENVLEIRSCTNILGFKNLDKACFDFLLPKFFDSSKGSSNGQRKCCKTKCCRSKTEASVKDNDASESEDVSSKPLGNVPEKKELSSPSKLSKSAESRLDQTETEPETEAESARDYSLLCPKYRKFQMACGSVPSYMRTCAPEVENIDSFLNCRPCSSSGGCEAAVIGKSPPKAKEKDVISFGCPLAKPAPTETSLSLCPGQETLQICKEPAEASCPMTIPSVGEAVEGPAAEPEGEDGLNSDCWTETGCPSPHSGLRADQRSSVEIEVATQLTSWPDIGGSRISVSLPAKKTSELHCWRQLELGPSTMDCPFLRDLGAVDAQVRGDERPSLSAGSPYVSSMNSGEDSDSFDTEGDSEFYSIEREREMQLPFSVERIASLSRNDFQQMLKTHSLTREQLDFVHDVRRRSKNRIAARRCRKRKLDCIHNLECEIERLRCEKEKLAAEKQRLDQLKLKTWQSYSGLYERLCSEAYLQPEQAQVFAKNTSLSECPFTARMSKGCFYHCPESPLQTTDTVNSKSGPSTSCDLEPPAGGTKPNMPDLHHANSPQTEERAMTSITNICPDQISKLETEQ